VIHVKNILYPTDFSTYSTQAYFHAIALAEKHGARLTIAYVYTPEPTGRDQTAGRQHWQDQLKQIHPVDPRIPVQHVFLEGDPATEILRHAENAGIDLIVMGTHGRTGLERLLMGSVTEKVMRDAKCSVLVVKLPKGMPTPTPIAVEAGRRA
jgi:nucleotide-binding universal stress UspA family protein